MPALSLNPSSYGYLLSGITRFADIVDLIASLRCVLSGNRESNMSHLKIIVSNKLAYLAVVNVHHMARRLCHISEGVQKDARQAPAGQISDLIRTTDEVDQVRRDYQ